MKPVLLIEDDPLMVQLTKITLHNMNLKLRHATSLEQGLELLGQEKFDLVILDLNLPDSRGVETMRRVAEVHDNIIVTTSQNETEVEISREGADDFVRKDELMLRLRDAVESSLKRRRRR